MHELSIMQSVVEACAERAGAARVNRVTVEIGRLTCVMPDALRFCYDVCTGGTTLEGSELEIIEVPGRARCLVCSEELDLNDLLTACACGSHDLELIAGQDLRIKEMEVI